MQSLYDINVPYVYNLMNLSKLQTAAQPYERSSLV